MLRITSVSVNLAKEPPLVAYANVIFNDEFIVRGVRVVRRRDGSRLVVMPSRPNKVGDLRDVAHPLTPECRARIESAVLAKVDEKASAEVPRA